MSKMKEIIIKFDKNELLIKTIYNDDKLKYQKIFLTNNNYSCFECGKQNLNDYYFKNLDSFHDYCKDCIFNQIELEKKLYKSIFRIMLNEFDQGAYGYFLDLKNPDNFCLVINDSFDNFEKIIKEKDFFNIILLNEKIIKINLDEVYNYFIFSDSICIFINKNYFFNDSINSLELADQDINQREVLVLSINDLKKIKLNQRSLLLTSILDINNNTFQIYNSENIEATIVLPILSLNNKKIIGTFKESQNNILYGKTSIIPKSYKYYNDNYQKFKKIFETQFNAVINSDLNEYYLKAIFNDEIFTVIRYNKNKKLEEAISFDINNNVYFIGNNHDQGKIIGNGK